MRVGAWAGAVFGTKPAIFGTNAAWLGRRFDGRKIIGIIETRFGCFVAKLALGKAEACVPVCAVMDWRGF